MSNTQVADDSDSDYFRMMCEGSNIPATDSREYDFVERVGIKVDSGMGVLDARKQAFSEVFA